MILLIDDCKEGGYADIVARNAVAACAILSHLIIKEIYIDFDLGSSSQNGNEVLKFAFEHGYIIADKIFIVSLNPCGRKMIEGILTDNGYIRERPGVYKRGE